MTADLLSAHPRARRVAAVAKEGMPRLLSFADSDLEAPVLSAEHRLRASSEFGAAVRRGRRAGRNTLTVHLLRSTHSTDLSRVEGVRAGLVVSKAVGGSVVRHQVARRLRHLLRDRVGALPPGSLLVVRAAPAAAAASSAELGADLDAALSRLASPRSGPSAVRAQR